MSERVTNSRQPHTIGDLVEPVIRVFPATFVREIKSMVGEEDPINAVVVVVEGKPIGLVMSLHLHQTLSQQFGVSLFADQPVATIMDPSPLILAVDIPVEEAASLAMDRPQKPCL